QLRLAVPTQKHTEVVEPGHNALKLDAVHQEDGQRSFRLADAVQEGVLKVLSFVLRHGRLILFLVFFIGREAEADAPPASATLATPSPVRQRLKWPRGAPVPDKSRAGGSPPGRACPRRCGPRPEIRSA